jgi:hypothetical protein
MYLVALALTALVAGGLCTDKPIQPRVIEGHVFGIEFSIDKITISFVSFGSHEVKSLAAVQG